MLQCGNCAFFIDIATYTFAPFQTFFRAIGSLNDVPVPIGMPERFYDGRILISAVNAESLFLSDIRASRIFYLLPFPVSMRSHIGIIVFMCISAVFAGIQSIALLYARGRNDGFGIVVSRVRERYTVSRDFRYSVFVRKIFFAARAIPVFFIPVRRTCGIGCLPANHNVCMYGIRAGIGRSFIAVLTACRKNYCT